MYHTDVDKNVKVIEAEGVLETNNENVRDILKSSGLNRNEVERPGSRIGRKMWRKRRSVLEMLEKWNIRAQVR